MKKGADFKTAAAAQHLTVQTLPAFVPRKASMKDMKQATLGYYSARLPVGAVSSPIPLESENSVLVLHVDSRAPADAAGFAAFEAQYGQSRTRNCADAPSSTGSTGRQAARHPSPAESRDLRRRAGLKKTLSYGFAGGSGGSGGLSAVLRVSGTGGAAAWSDLRSVM